MVPGFEKGQDGKSGQTFCKNTDKCRNVSNLLTFINWQKWAKNKTDFIITFGFQAGANKSNKQKWLKMDENC